MNDPAKPAVPPIPDFPRADPGTPAFWDMRFSAGFTPWDPGEAPALLADFVRSWQGVPPSVLVPGCGAAREVALMADAGWDVTAIDFSPEAVTRARAALGPHAARVVERDFFAPQAGEPFDLVYERAFLCALPPAMRADWAARMASLVRPGGRLVGFFYFDDGTRGPPFGIAPAALDALLGPAFTRIDDRVPPDSIPVFAGKERWQAWVRR